ncbi:MAG TPA: hypothetical protein DEH22_03680 [Chloroflexi bacterium]|nr:hypothetical protein [Chloroflexota bacterium]
MTTPLTVGSATAQPGTLQYGRWEALAHPTGHTEFLPVIIAQGCEPGPCIWLTAGIHGNEHSGPVILYQLLTQALVDQLRGTIVAIPALNPAGLRTTKREPYHAPTDPNRLWPDGKPPKPLDPEKEPPSSLETAYARLFAEMQKSADYLIDYHNTWPHSIPFAFRDRVLYRADENEAQNKAEAEALAAKLDEMLKVFGHTIINEYPSEKYIDLDLHRSTSGAALLVGRIPAFTVELGSGLMPNLNITQAALSGTRNVLRWVGMLEGEMEAIAGIKVVETGFPVRRSGTLRASQACVSIPRVKSGDLVQTGDRLADLVDIWGRPLETIEAPSTALVLSPSYGVYFYPSDTVVYLAVRDEEALTGPYPADYFKADD